MKHQAPAIKSWAQERHLPLLQPEKLRDGLLQSWLKDRDVDVAVVLAYGRILPPDVLATPRHGCVNLHASLLPRHRGAAPIQCSILSGDDQTGVSLMQMDAGLDTGPVFSRHSIAIAPGEDAGTLTQRLSMLAAEVLRMDLPRVITGELVAVAQDSALATLAPPIRHADQLLDFRQDAGSLARRILALSPRPGALTEVRQRRLKLLTARVAPDSTSGPPGQVALRKRRILVATGEGTLELLRLQLEGKSAQNAADMVNGRGVLDGDQLGLS